MTKKYNKNYCVFLAFITIIAMGLVWYYSQATVDELNMLTGNISSLVIEKKDKPADDPKDKNNLEEEFTCSQPVLKVNSAGYYYGPQGDQLGVGPLPPKAGVQTSYWVFWEISDLNEDLENFEITAQLPDRVVWNNKKTALAGSLQYGEITRKVIWTADEVNKKGTYKVGFEIGLIPENEDIGKILNLLTNIKYNGIDKSCGEKVSGNLANITTDLKEDKLGGNKGTVVPFE